MAVNPGELLVGLIGIQATPATIGALMPFNSEGQCNAKRK